MSQSWTDNVFQTDHQGQTDLQNMENNFACLKTLFSGTGAPSSMGACHPWFDTTQHVLKVRDDGDSAWLGLMHGDTSQKIWVYRNTAMNGWAVDSSSATDRVLALKGGSTYTTGAANAGTWTQPNHTLSISELPAHDHGGDTGNESAHTHPITGGSFDEYGSQTGICSDFGYNDGLGNTTGAGSSHDHSISSQGGGSAHNHGSTYRPAAAVGTLQYLDL